MATTITFGNLEGLLGRGFSAKSLVNISATRIDGSITSTKASPNEVLTYNGLTGTITNAFIAMPTVSFKVVAVSDTANTVTIDAFYGTKLIAELGFTVGGFSRAGILLVAMPLDSMVTQASNLAGLAGSLFVLGPGSGGARTQSITYTLGAAYSFLPDAGVHFATAANPVLQGGHGPQMLIALSGNTTITAGGGRTVIYGGPGDDLMTAGKGNAMIYGGSGQDTIIGGSGFAMMIAGSGSDTIYAGTGRSVVAGGSGKDTFVFAPGHTGGLTADTADSIQHFRPGLGDLIDLTAFDTLLPVGGTGHLTFIGTSPFDGLAGELRYDTTSTGLTLQGDLTGAGTADVLLTMKNTFTISASSFLL